MTLLMMGTFVSRLGEVVISISLIVLRKKQPELVREDVQGEERFWGVFSLEGGKADNMTNILTHMKHIHKYLEEEYLPDKDVYKAFLKQYEAVRALRAQAQTFAHSLRARRDCADELERARTSYQKESARSGGWTSSGRSAVRRCRSCSCAWRRWAGGRRPPKGAGTVWSCA